MQHPIEPAHSSGIDAPQMNDPFPARKVMSAGLSGALTTILIWLAGEFGAEMPTEVATALVSVVIFLAGYFTRPGSWERVQQPSDCDDEVLQRHIDRARELGEPLKLPQGTYHLKRDVTIPPPTDP